GHDMARSKSAADKVRALPRRLADIEQRIAPPQSDDPIAHAEARVARINIEPERLRVEADLARAKREVEAAIEADRAELRATFVALKREAVPPLIEAMKVAQQRMIVLADIENREHELLSVIDRFSWSSLNRNDVGESFFAEWCQRLRLAGLLG